MPVSYAMRKFANALPDVLPPAAAVVVSLLLLPPPPPHPAATSAKQAMTDAATSHFHAFLRFKSYLPVLRFAVAAQRRPRRPSARLAFFQTSEGRSWLEPQRSCGQSRNTRRRRPCNMAGSGSSTT